MVTQIPGGMLAEKYGGKWVFAIGILLTDFFCLLTPLAARHGGPGAVIAVRILTGLSEVNLQLSITNQYKIGYRYKYTVRYEDMK